MSEMEMRTFVSKLASQVDHGFVSLTPTRVFDVVLEEDDVNVLRRFIET